MIKQALGAVIALSGSGILVSAGMDAAWAQSAPAPDAAAQAGPPSACALPSLAASADLEQVPGSDLVTVPVAIGGKPKKLLLAVGSGASAVTQATVKELKLIDGIKLTEIYQTGPAYWSDDTSLRNQLQGGVMQSTVVDVRSTRAAEDGRPHVNIPAFTIGKATGHNLSFAVMDDNDVPKSLSYDGTLTGSFFKQYDVELDFAAMKLNYLTPTTCTDPHQVVFWPHKDVAVIPMTIASGKIEVEVDIGGHKVQAVLDTGSARSIMRRDIAENTVGLKAGSPQMPLAGDMRDGKDMPVYTATFPQITFAGGVTAFNVPALIQSNGMTHNLHKEPMLGSRALFKDDPRIPAFTLGMDVLRQLHLYVVYGQNIVYMTATE